VDPGFGKEFRRGSGEWKFSSGVQGLGDESKTIFCQN